ncbi:group II truncated hemoglobin [Aestuariivirga sp.]|uniref:group II truncated hemoglobin n=1 Tax=Aestuariivirga sp. TaxID=2650926 RepID=UPI0039E65D2F
MGEAQFQTPYDRLGGAEGVRRLVETFYDLVETAPEGAPLVLLHNEGNGIAHARHAQFLFLSGFLGGPQLYAEQFRHSNVRKMHEHLKISPIESQSWLACMDMALAKTTKDSALRRQLMQTFTRVATALQTPA